jgi:hypothetical protein
MKRACAGVCDMGVSFSSPTARNSLYRRKTRTRVKHNVTHHDAFWPRLLAVTLPFDRCFERVWSDLFG